MRHFCPLFRQYVQSYLLQQQRTRKFYFSWYSSHGYLFLCPAIQVARSSHALHFSLPLHATSDALYETLQQDPCSYEFHASASQTDVYAASTQTRIELAPRPRIRITPAHGRTETREGKILPIVFQTKADPPSRWQYRRGVGDNLHGTLC